MTGVQASAASVTPDELKEVKVYPNPFEDKIRVDVAGEKITSMRVVNIVGEVVAEVTVPFTKYVEVDLSDLRKGVYFLNFSDGKESYSKRIIKQ